MPTVAETQLAAVAAWFVANSAERPTPMGKDVMRPGVYATLVPVGIDEAGPDVEALCAQGVLPIFTPQAVSAGINLTPPTGQPALVERVEHTIWKAQQAPYAPDVGFPAVVVVGLATPITTIRQALTAAGLGSLDLATRGVLAVPLYAFDTVTRSRVAPELPVL